MTLGDLIDVLEGCDQNAMVEFDGGDFPLRFASWRGVYADLTLVPTHDGQPPSVASVLEMARAADGATFQGWKGGDFTMARHTPVWADAEGDYYSRGILGLRPDPDNGRVVLQTADLSDYR